jgi:hypothetical protein
VSTDGGWVHSSYEQFADAFVSILNTAHGLNLHANSMPAEDISDALKNLKIRNDLLTSSLLASHPQMHGSSI